MIAEDDGEDDVWFVTGETTEGQPLKPFATIDLVDGLQPVRGVNEIAFAYACGAVQAGTMVVLCDCGCVRQHDRPHDYVADIQLRGWNCYCGIFNGEEKERQGSCRTCGAPRPM